MATNGNMPLEDYFPKLVDSDYRITSPASPSYNCIAWAVGDSTRWWWPDPLGLAYWPENVPRQETLESFRVLLRTLGFDLCEAGDVESDLDKVALYAKGEQPTHAARQLETGLWSSKLGPLEDIEHSLDDLAGDCYGQVVGFYGRQRRQVGNQQDE